MSDTKMKTIILAFLLFASSIGIAADSTYYGIDGQSVVMTASATGTEPMTYQWFKDGVAVAGATAKTYSVKLGTASAGAYTVKVSNQAGASTSPQAIIIIARAPGSVSITITFQTTP